MPEKEAPEMKIVTVKEGLEAARGQLRKVITAQQMAGEPPALGFFFIPREKGNERQNTKVITFCRITQGQLLALIEQIGLTPTE